MAALLTLTGVGARYGQVEVLHGIDLEVAEQEKVTVLGPNGAGKTTLMRAISRTVSASGGITFGGTDLLCCDAPAAAAAGLGHVPSGRGTFSALTVQENLNLGLAGRSRGGQGARPERRRDLQLILEIFPDLGRYANRPAGQLSGGQQQMLALARALLARPRLLLVDEPSQGLAPLVVRSLFEALAELQERWGLALLLAEQNARLALALADRAYVLVGGHVVLARPAAGLTLDDLQSAYLGGSATTSGRGAR